MPCEFLRDRCDISFTLLNRQRWDKNSFFLHVKFQTLCDSGLRRHAEMHGGRELRDAESLRVVRVLSFFSSR